MHLAQPHHRVADIHQGFVNGMIGGCARKRPDVAPEVIGRNARIGKQFGATAASERLIQVGGLGENRIAAYCPSIPWKNFRLRCQARRAAAAL